jgi:hypothetical protein
MESLNEYLAEKLEYRGWKIDHCDARPVTGKWKVHRYGVAASFNNLESCKRYVDEILTDPEQKRWYGFTTEEKNATN